jgi:hypothetical protein
MVYFYLVDYKLIALAASDIWGRLIFILAGDALCTYAGVHGSNKSGRVQAVFSPSKTSNEHIHSCECCVTLKSTVV